MIWKVEFANGIIAIKKKIAIFSTRSQHERIQFTDIKELPNA